jgi:hypothetical protein
MGMSDKLHVLVDLTSRNSPGTFWIGSWLAPELVWTILEKRKSFASAGIQASDHISVANRYTNYAILVPGTLDRQGSKAKLL